MNNPELWSTEYFIDLINRKIKYEIFMYFLVHYDRRPTKDEYLEYFSNWKDQLSCNVGDYDLGIFE